MFLSTGDNQNSPVENCLFICSQELAPSAEQKEKYILIVSFSYFSLIFTLFIQNKIQTG